MAVRDALLRHESGETEFLVGPVQLVLRVVELILISLVQVKGFGWGLWVKA